MSISNTKSGFTLLELSVVLIIGGLIVVAAIEAYTIYFEKQKIERTNSIMTDINQYMANFPSKIDPSTMTIDVVTGQPDPRTGTPYARLPAPAPLNSAAAGNNFSREADILNAAGTLDATKVANAVASGALIRVNGTGSSPVLIGKLPTATLGIRNDYMRDAYDNFHLYAVTLSSAVESTFNTTAGAIHIIEEGVERDSASPDFGSIVKLDDHPNVQFTVISMGKSNEGGYAFDGSRIGVCDATIKEGENCDGDAVFRSSLLFEPNTPNFYDDAVIFESNVVNLAEQNEPASCDQSESLTTYADSCPDGWDEESNFFGDPAPTYDGSSPYGDEAYVGYDNMGSVNIKKTKNGDKHYYNVDPDTGDYYMTSFPTDNTALAPQGGQRKILCNKNPSSDAKTKCFTKQVTTQASSGTDLGGMTTSALEDSCPDGWNIVDYEHKHSDLSGNEASWSRDDYTVTCGK